MSQITTEDGFNQGARLTQTPSHVSTPALAANHSFAFGPRKSSATAQAILSNKLIPRDYLASRSRPPPLDKSRAFSESAISSTRPQAPPREYSCPTYDEAAAVAPGGSDGKTHTVTAALGQAQAEVMPAYMKEEDTLKVPRTRGPDNLNIAPIVEGEITSFPESPKSFASSVTSSNLPKPPLMPRTSSIDSAISSVSNGSMAQKGTLDLRDPSSADIGSLVATAGSAENLILHLLKEKNQAVTQNAQLWKLVDKQRALLLGLNKDLERVTKDRDRYKNRAKETQTEQTLGPIAEQGDGRAESTANGALSTRADDRAEPEAVEKPSSQPHLHSTPIARVQSPLRSSPIDSAMMPSPLHVHSLTEEDAPLSPTPCSGSALPVTVVLPPAQEEPIRDKPKLQSLSTSLAAPTFALTEPSPLAEKSNKSFTAARKTAPKPLNLSSLKDDISVLRIENESAVSDEVSEQISPVNRGRRKTREEDDRERQVVLLQEQEARSLSNKERQEPGASEVNTTGTISGVLTPALPTNLPTRSDLTDRLTAPTADSSTTVLHVTERLLSPPLRSPGLPASPRPMDRSLVSSMPSFAKDHSNTIQSLPLSPRVPVNIFPLSPRAPKQPIPLPGSPTEDGGAPLLRPRQYEPSAPMQIDTSQPADRPQMHESPLSPDEIPTVYRGLASPTYPDLLLPPNALPSVRIMVASSRLKPARFSMLGFRPQEDSSVFSLSIFSRSNRNELWRPKTAKTAGPQVIQWPLTCHCRRSAEGHRDIF